MDDTGVLLAVADTMAATLSLDMLAPSKMLKDLLPIRSSSAHIIIPHCMPVTDSGIAYDTPAQIACQGLVQGIDASGINFVRAVHNRVLQG